MSNRRWLRSGTLLVLCLMSRPGSAQQIRNTTSRQGIGQGFFEQTGVGWGLQHQHSGGFMFFSNGGPGPLPPFGGFDPNAQSHFGLGGVTGDVRWNFGIYAGQGSSHSMTSQAPGIVLPDGSSGYLFNTMQQPFVTGIVPVVGAPGMTPLQERIVRLRYEQALRGLSKHATETKRPSAASAETKPRPKQPRQDDPPLILK